MAPDTRVASSGPERQALIAERFGGAYEVHLDCNEIDEAVQGRLQKIPKVVSFWAQNDGKTGKTVSTIHCPGAIEAAHTTGT